MAQDEQLAERTEQLAEALKGPFDEARLRLAQTMAKARDGQLIDDIEMPVFDELNRLKTLASEVGLQTRIEEIEAAFSPSGQVAQAAQ